MSEVVEEKKKLSTTEKILIAVIAISVVLIIIFGLKILNNKAQVLTGDQAICNRINTILEEKTEAGKTYKTLNSVLDDLAENGYLVENLTPSLNELIYVYNMEDNSFALVDSLSENAKVIFGKLSKTKANNWFIVDKESEIEDTPNYSHFLAEGFKASSKSIEVNTGLDCGDNDCYSKITYSGQDGTYVRYNYDNCQLVNSSSADIKQYNSAE